MFTVGLLGPARSVFAASDPSAEDDSAAQGQNRVTCSSRGTERQHCPADTSSGVALAKSTGSAPCLLGKTWGYDSTGISQIFGHYGDASELRAGANWYFVKERGLRVNAEWIHLDNCPVGYTAVPYPVGGSGSVFHINIEMNF